MFFISPTVGWIFHLTRTNRDSAGQIRTALAARPNIAFSRYLWAGLFP